VVVFPKLEPKLKLFFDAVGLFVVAFPKFEPKLKLFFEGEAVVSAFC
jgi:hypothetical protein